MAAHLMNFEWVIVKGISHFHYDGNTPDESWKSFASVMAASVVSYMLNVPGFFKEWPHYGGMHPCSSEWLFIAMNFLFRYFHVDCRFNTILSSNLLSVSNSNHTSKRLFKTPNNELKAKRKICF